MIDVMVPRDVRDGVVAAMDSCFEDIAQRIGQVEGFDGVWETAREASEGGKMLRPHLLLSAYGAFAVEPAESAVQVAAAMELLHLAFLLHDDVIDRDLVRRGRPNLIARRYDIARGQGMNDSAALRYGDGCAILAGDVLLSAAHRLVAEVDEPLDVRRGLLRALDDAILAAAVGEHADLVIGLRGVADESAILRTMRDKTARYSFSAPLRMGALLGGASAEVIAALGVIGDTIGIAFQARDDVLGVFGDPQRTGKSALSDLREGKVTLLIAAARADPAWREVAHLFGRPELEETDAALIRAVIERSGARTRVEAAITRFAEDARASLEPVTLPSTLVDDLERVLVTVTEPLG
ncbi:MULTISPECIES: polyprenyl synthetase family protein [Bacteria]|uniref:polyprenyl synthetase family protein n=1 Tax=Bacteria TaxID=2 RepID=UPI003C7B1E88